MNKVPGISKSSDAVQPRPIGARESFLSCFSTCHRREIVEFGKRLRKVDADYLIFMARKSVCFYESLAALKLTELRGILVSDRVLDMDLSWLKGKRVALIDDAVIYGSTLLIRPLNRLYYAIIRAWRRLMRGSCQWKGAGCCVRW
jgi:hypothetical protein